MKVLFLQKSGTSEFLGITEIAGILRAYGHTCDLLIGDEEKDLIRKIKAISPDIVAFPCWTASYEWPLRIAEQIKKELEIITVFGGHHVTIYPESMINRRGVDILCLGEGEYPILELLEKLELGKDIKEINNLWVKEGDRVYKNPIGPLLQNLDKLPFPYRELYYKYDFIKNRSIKRFIAGRGCPYSCTFCFNSLLKNLFQNKGRYIRQKSTKRIIEEVKYVKERFPLRTVHFSDDTFTLDRGWLIKFLDTFKKEVGLPFTCNVRIDHIDDEIAKRLSERGCLGITFGLETANEFYRHHVLKKEINNSKIKAGVRLLKKYKIRILTTNLIALPEETISDVFKTLEMNVELGIDYARIFKLHPFPKLEIAEYAKDRGLFNNDFSLKDYKANQGEYTIESRQDNKFKNLHSLFHLGLKFPFLIPIIKQTIKLPNNRFFRKLGNFYRMYTEMRFYNVPFSEGYSYYKHTGSFNP